MVSWLAKALVQRSIGALPNPHFWNELFQHRVTHSLDLTQERFEAGLRDCRNHLAQLQRFGSPPTNDGFSVFELGTGWFPTVAIGFFVCGAREVWTWDIVSFLRRDRLKLVFRRFVELGQGDALRVGFCALPERLTRLEEVTVLCDQPNELGPAELLARLGMLEVTRFNFLRFSDRAWRWLKNTIIPLNRLRVRDYRRAFSESGFQVVAETSQHGDPGELARTPPGPGFAATLSRIYWPSILGWWRSFGTTDSGSRQSVRRR